MGIVGSGAYLIVELKDDSVHKESVHIALGSNPGDYIIKPDEVQAFYVNTRNSIIKDPSKELEKCQIEYTVKNLEDERRMQRVTFECPSR